MVLVVSQPAMNTAGARNLATLRPQPNALLILFYRHMTMESLPRHKVTKVPTTDGGPTSTPFLLFDHATPTHVTSPQVNGVPRGTHPSSKPRIRNTVRYRSTIRKPPNCTVSRWAGRVRVRARGEVRILRAGYNKLLQKIDYCSISWRRPIVCGFAVLRPQLRKKIKSVVPGELRHSSSP